MYCKKCGNELADNARFCGACGTPVIQQTKTNVINSKPKKSKLKYFIIGIVVVCLGVIGTITGFKVKNHLAEVNELKKYDVVGAVIPAKDTTCMSEKEVYEEIKARGFDVEAEDIDYFYDIEGNNYGKEDFAGIPNVKNAQKSIDPSSDEKHPTYQFVYTNKKDKQFTIEISGKYWYTADTNYYPAFAKSITSALYKGTIIAEDLEKMGYYGSNGGAKSSTAISERETYLNYYDNESYENPNSFVVEEWTDQFLTDFKVDKLTSSVLDNITYDDLYGSLMDEYGLVKDEEHPEYYE